MGNNRIGMTSTAYIVIDMPDRADTLGLLPGLNYWKARLVRGGPYVGVRTEVIVPRDAAGEVDGDAIYKVEIDGHEIAFKDWHGRAMIGEPIDEAAYRLLVQDLAWNRVANRLHEKEPVDVRKMKPVLPPGM